ncbi:MAG: enoyl-ACP reductase [Chloroflexi bacterium]|nr:enoyl-ACP reductase [Chloroflexota bacterium]
MYTIDLSGKVALILGVANHRSIAWAIGQILHQAGAKLAISYQNERLKESVDELAAPLKDTLLLECDVSRDDHVPLMMKAVAERFRRLDIVVHSIAFANREDLGGKFSETGREGFRLAMDISAYSLIPIVRHAAPLMTDGGSILTLTFHASERVFPGYNIMGTAKAALENEVRQLAAELGEKNIRVNAISAGPLDTLSSRVISGYRDMKRIHQERSPMKRNISHEEVAKTALYLCSDLSSGVTGAVIPVDTGYSIMGI